MTISDAINRLQTNLTNSYSSCEEKGATLPEKQNFDNLPATIESIQKGSFYATLKVVTNEGAIVNINKETKESVGGVALFYLYDAGDYTVICEKDGQTKSGTITISSAREYEITIYPQSDAPDNYQQLEYIQSNGTGFIDTGFKFSSNTAKISLKVAMTRSTSNCNIFGSATDYDSSWFGIYIGAGYEGGLYCGDNRVLTIYFTQNQIKTLAFDRQEDVLYYTNNGTTQQIRVGGTIVCGNNLMIASQPPLGANRSPQGVNYYAFSVEQDGLLVRDFIPVYRKADGVNGMYDRVNSRFYPPTEGTFNRGQEI